MYTVKVSKNILVVNEAVSIKWSCDVVDSGDNILAAIEFETNEQVTEEDIIERCTPVLVSLEKHYEAAEKITISTLAYEYGKVVTKYK